MIYVLELAKYLIYLSVREAEQAGDEAVSDIDPMKLQKLLYYCQGYSLGLTGKPFETMQRDFEKALTEEMQDEEKEDKLWNSLGRKPTEEEWKRIGVSVY